MACSTVGLISSMDGALHPVIAKVRVRFSRSSLHLSGSFSTAYLVPSTAMIILISLSYTCISIHVIYHELTMTCSPLGLISSMDRALSLGPNPGQDWIFSGSFFHPPTLFILLRWSCSLSHNELNSEGQLDSSGLCDLINFRKNCHTQVHIS